VDWSGETVLVTGAQGFIGSWLAERLAAEGAQVVVLRRDHDPGSRFHREGVEERCTVVQADILDYESLLRVIHQYRFAAVFHLAAQALVGIANRSPLATYESNVRGTYTLLEAIRAAGVVGDRVERVVVASSDKAYGDVEELPYREGQPLEPAYPYDVSKACADLIARSYAVTFDMPVAVTRLANVYGGGDANFSRLVPETMRAIVRGERPVLRSDGTPERDFIYVEDAVDAYLAVAESLERPELRGRAWNAGAGQPIAVMDLVRRAVAVSGKDVEPDVQGEGTPHGEIDRQYLDSTAIRDELGWQPRWDLDRGLAETYGWYESHLAEA
jgi:CDP-glucose 4,6-dehydratase